MHNLLNKLIISNISTQIISISFNENLVNILSENIISNNKLNYSISSMNHLTSKQCSYIIQEDVHYNK